jgi:hypothetical protein
MRVSAHAVDSMNLWDEKLLSWLGWTVRERALASDDRRVTYSQYKPFAEGTETCTGCGPGVFFPNGARAARGRQSPSPTLCSVSRRTGTVNAAIERSIARTYAQAVAGSISQMRFDPATALFSLNFTTAPAITAPTVIFLSEAIHYPGGFTVNVVPASAAKWTHPQRNYVHVRPHARCRGAAERGQRSANAGGSQIHNAGSAATPVSVVIAAV